MADLPEVREEIRAMQEALSRESYLHKSGQKPTLELAPIYRRHGHLFALELVQSIRERRDATNGAGGSLSQLYGYLARNWIMGQTRELREAIANDEAAATVTVGDETTSFFGAVGRISNEPDRAIRQAWTAARNAVEATFVPRYEELWAAYFNHTRTLGYPSYLAFCEDIHGHDYASLNIAMQQYLAATLPVFQKAFDGRCRELIGVPLNRADREDIGYLLRNTELDAQFPREQLVPMIEAFTAGLGLPITNESAIELDLVERPGKVPRAFCSSIRVGEEIRVNLLPSGGVNDYTTLLHEVGHAYHGAYTNTDLTIEQQTFGDRAVSEGFAYIFNYLPENPLWMQRYLGVKDPAPLMRAVLLRKLWLTRRYAAKLNYELALHDHAELAGKDSLYLRNLEDALLVKHEAQRYVIDLDSDLYCADYVRAWVWEMQLRTHLEQTFGLEWFANPQAGAALIELWRLGRSLTADAMARQLGYDGLRPALLADRMQADLVA